MTSESSLNIDLASLLKWLSEEVPNPLPENVAHDHYLLMHPRISYLKNLPLNSVVMDIGAGSGALRGFRQWLGFLRMDLKFIGLSLEHGEHTRDYEEFHLVNLDQEKPALTLQPTNVVAAQVIEHIEDPQQFLHWMYSVLPPGGSAFVDWPSWHTGELPRRDDLKAAGYEVTTINFFDDSTHQKLINTEELIQKARQAGFLVTNTGCVDMPYLAESLKHHGLKNNDSYLLSMAIWLKVNFISYITLKKPDAPAGGPAVV